MKIDYWNTHTRQVEQFDVIVTKQGSVTGRWRVLRADNRRALGWVEAPALSSESWSAHIEPSAFRGDDKDDTGDVLDSVPNRLFGHGNSPVNCPAIDRASTRRSCVEAIITHLNRHRAPALGFERHPDVVRYQTYARTQAGVTV